MSTPYSDGESSENCFSSVECCRLLLGRMLFALRGELNPVREGGRHRGDHAERQSRHYLHYILAAALTGSCSTNSRSTGRTTSTGHGAVRTTCSAALPMMNLETPVRPWVPRMIRPA